MTLAAAVADWGAAIGPEHVVTDAATLAAAGRATFATAQRIPAIIRPGSREDVQACLRIAGRHGTPVYPVSTGRNWGFGSRVPARDGSVLMELARMDRILDFDEDLAYVTVQPGVTFRALREFLAARGSRLGVPATGSSQDGSLIGNALERGIGIGRYGHRARHTCGLEVVLPTGECIRSGMAAHPGATAGPLHRGGPGPEIDGLFFQSNLGVVTSMTLWLAPILGHVQFCYFAVEEDERLGPVIDALRGLLLQGVLSPLVTLRNAYSLLVSSGQRYPWEALDGATPLPPSVLARSRALLATDAWWSCAWAGFGWLHAASAAHAEALREIVRDALGGRVDRLVFAGSAETTISAWAGARDRDAVRASFEGLDPHGWLGGDTDAAGFEVYWRKHGALPDRAEPERDGCGVIFCTPTVPLAAGHVVACAEMLSRTALHHGFEPILNIQAIEERAAYVAAMVVFDRHVPGEDQRALACHREMLRAALASGWVPHRVAAPALPAPAPDAETAAFLSRLKQAVDPEGILAPGRYDHGAPKPGVDRDTRA